MSDKITGVVTVLTDDKSDIPDELPDIFNFIDEVYPWEEYDENTIDSFAVGTYPELDWGYSYTDEIEEPEPTLDELNEYAELYADAVSDLLGRSGMLGRYANGSWEWNAVSFVSDENGEWRFVGSVVESMGQYDDSDHDQMSVSASFTDEMNGRLESIDREYGLPGQLNAAFYFYHNKFVGAGVMYNPYAKYDEDILNYGANLPMSEDYDFGGFPGWAMTEENDDLPTAGHFSSYLSNDWLLGTYSVTTGAPLRAVSYAERYGESPSGGFFTADSYIGEWVMPDIADFLLGVTDEILAAYPDFFDTIRITMTEDQFTMDSPYFGEIISAQIIFDFEDDQPVVWLVEDGYPVEKDYASAYIIFNEDYNEGMFYDGDGSDPIAMVRAVG